MGETAMETAMVVFFEEDREMVVVVVFFHKVHRVMVEEEQSHQGTIVTPTEDRRDEQRQHRQGRRLVMQQKQIQDQPCQRTNAKSNKDCCNIIRCVPIKRTTPTAILILIPLKTTEEEEMNGNRL